MRSKFVLAMVAAAALVTAAVATAAFKTSVKPYAVGIAGGYAAEALLSVGDRVPETSDPSREYQMVGIPDGLGAHSHGNSTVVYMNHELTFDTRSEPLVGRPLNRGPIVSRVILDRDGHVVSADRAYDVVYQDDALVGPAPEVGNATRSFTRFCSGSLAGPQHGFDRWIYFANEESGGALTFDGKGGQAVAVFDGEAHALSWLGRFAWENSLVQQNTGRYTVVMGMEDGPASQDPTQVNSQLYMYVGVKDRSSGATALERNGLVGGKLFVFRSKDPARNSESAFLSGSITGEWVWIPGANAMTDLQLEAASDAVNAMVFARPEDGAFSLRDRDDYYFVTTGEGTGNTLGRLYRLELDHQQAWDDARLNVEYNADQIVAAGGDVAISPDNMDVSKDYLMINEDGTASSRPVMGAKGRDGSIWRFEYDENGIDLSSRTRVAELDPPGRDGVAVGPGIWETSGIIDATDLFGKNTWLFDVQAHPPTTAPRPNTVEDGQLLLMRGPR